MNYSECTVLITGASGNLGAALSRHFATKCRHLVLTGRSADRLEAVADEVAGLGGSATTVAADLTKVEDIQKIQHAVGDGDTPLDILVHNAADVTSKPLRDTPTEEIDSLLRTNVAGPLQLTRALLPAMDRSQYKRIVWISSLAGYKSNPSQTVYSISKSGVNAAAAALRAELGGTGYHVLNVPLSTVSFDGSDDRNSASKVCARIEDAIASGQRELFLSPVSRLLMRLYGLLPGAMRY